LQIVSAAILTTFLHIQFSVQTEEDQKLVDIIW